MMVLVLMLLSIFMRLVAFEVLPREELPRSSTEFFGLKGHLENLNTWDSSKKNRFKKYLRDQELYPFPLSATLLEKTFLKQNLSLHIDGFEKQFLSFDRGPASDRTCEHPKVALSLIVFKPYDVDKLCSQVIEEAKKRGLRKITFFAPIPYSKESGETKFLLQGAPTNKEIQSCLDKLVKENFDLYYIPHLEDIATLIPGEKPKWRMEGGVELSKKYYEIALRPLLSFVEKNKSRLRPGQLTASLSAETDPSFFYSATDVWEFVADFKKRYPQIQLTWNPNGEVNHGWNQFIDRKIDCPALSKVIAALDSWGPSLYEEHDHLIMRDGRVDFLETKNRLIKRFQRKIGEYCPEISLSKLNEITFYAGEFALAEKSDSNYFKVLSHLSGVDFVGFWNDSSWDHLNLKGQSTNRKHQKDLSRSFASCSE